MRRGLSFLLTLLAAVLLPGSAEAQWVFNSTWAEPSPFTQEDEIAVHVEGDWDTETWDWPCDAIEMDGTCIAVAHAAYVWGSDGFSDSDWRDDWGWSTGSDSWEFWDLDGPVWMEPIGYSTQVAVDYCDEWYQGCWEVTADGYASVEPASVQIEITSDNGDTVWWLNGESPSGYPTSITLTSSGGSSTEWSIQSDNHKVDLSNSSGSTTTVTATGYHFSQSIHDVAIVADVGGNSTSFQLTVRSPSYLEAEPGKYVTNCTGWGTYGGYESSVWYQIRDNLNDLIPSTIPLNEAFVQSEPDDDWPGGSNWPMPAANGEGAASSINTSELWDRIAVHLDSSYTPTTVNNCSDSTAVDHWTQEWSIGSSTEWYGVFVKGNTLRRYRGRADHTDIWR